MESASKEGKSIKSCNAIKSVCTILFALIIVSASESFAQKQEEVLASFEKRVAIFEEFFSSNPKWLRKETYESSPTGYCFVYFIYAYPKISYDVRKTDSLVSPYMGYITVICRMGPSHKCGDVKVRVGGQQMDFFSTLDSARRERDNEACYDYGKSSRELKFSFAFQKNDWVLKGVSADNHSTFEFRPLFGGPLPSGRFYVEDNDLWKKLFD